MNQPTDLTAESVAQAEARLARLGVQIDTMQAVLVRLLQDVIRAEGLLDRSQAARLLEVNAELVVAALSSQTDAEDAAQAMTSAARSAALDALTRLPNRTTLLDRIHQAIAGARRHGTRFALLYMDIDDFKQFNDTHGHPFGDKVLCLAAERMLSVVREVDTVSRQGGDEFLILLAELADPRDALAVAEKLVAAIGVRAESDGLAFSMSASIGIAVYPDDGEDIDTLIARADAAMYATKRRRSGGVAFHGAGPADEAPQPAGPVAPSQQPARRRTGDPTEVELRHAHLREANERLVLAAITARELQAAAEQALQRQAALMAAVAEELGNPLAPIRIASAMLGRLPSDPPLLPRVQEIVQVQLTRQSGLIGQLLDASTATPAGLELALQPVDMTRIIDAAVATSGPTMAVRGQHFDLHCPPGALEVRGDAVRLEQIVVNLLDNASKHTHDGGRIGLAVAATADTLTLTVSDDGIGITPLMLPHVFEPFVQDTNALGFHGIGLGIGLTVVRALVRAHGGELVVTQELISQMLGVRREGVTEAALSLQRVGLISYRRGRITVLDRPGLERRSCECYGVVRAEYDRLLPEDGATWPALRGDIRFDKWR